MFRRLFTFLSAVSLVLFIATCVFWVRSQWVKDVVGDVRQEASQWQWFQIVSSNGQMYVSYLTIDFSPDEAAQFRPLPVTGLSHYARSPSNPWWHGDTTMEQIGFIWQYKDPLAPSVTLHMAIGVPHWVLAAAFAVLPAFRWRRLLRRRGKLPAGHCPTCGYDLRATPTRCPECGAIPATVSSPGPGG